MTKTPDQSAPLHEPVPPSVGPEAALLVEGPTHANSPAEEPAEGKKPRGKKEGGLGKAKATTAKKLAAALAGVAALTDAKMPAEERMAPHVRLDVPLSALCRHLAMLFRREALFVGVVGGAVVTVCPATGIQEVMTSLRFPSWAEERATFVKRGRGGDDIVVSLSAELCAKVLASDIFRRALRPLSVVHRVRLPSWAGPERRAVKLLPAGYDESTQSYTVDLCPYDTEQEPDAARFHLLETHAEFPLARPEGEPEQPLEENRNFAVQVAAMFAAYCRPLLTGCLRPAVAVQANQAGSGKTLLLRMALAPVYGAVSVQAAPRDEAELGKVLTTCAAEGRQYLVMDNISGYLASAEMEAFLTSPRRCGRILGRSESVDAENNLAVYLTGNGLHLSPDLARRCLLLDLWHPGDVAERQIKNPLDEEGLASNATRAGFLSALWALVKYWSDHGCPRSTGARLPTFETFSDVIGGLVLTAKFADPIARPDVSLDPIAAAWKTLFRALADGIRDGGSAEYGLQEILDAAEEGGLSEILIGESKNPKVSLGKRLARWKGRQFMDTRGRPFEFGHRYAAVGAKYTVRILTPAPVDADAD